MVAKYAAGLSIFPICSRDMPLWKQRFIHMMAYIAKMLVSHALLSLHVLYLLCLYVTICVIGPLGYGRQLGRPGRRRRPAGLPTW